MSESLKARCGAKFRPALSRRVGRFALNGSTPETTEIEGAMLFIINTLEFGDALC